MAVGKRTIELTKIAAAALADKLGNEIIAIDLSEQLVLNQVFLLVTGNNEPQLPAQLWLFGHEAPRRARPAAPRRPQL